MSFLCMRNPYILWYKDSPDDLYIIIVSIFTKHNPEKVKMGPTALKGRSYHLV